MMRAELMLADGDFYGGGGGGGGAGGDGGYSPPPMMTASAPAPPPPSSSGIDLLGHNFDLSPTNIQAAVSRGNSESDIRSSYQSFLTGRTDTGRGGTYAANDSRKYGVSIQQAASSYLQWVGIPFLSSAPAPAPVAPPPIDPIPDGDFFELPYLDPEPGPDSNGVVTNPEPTGKGDPFQTIEQLADLMRGMFAGAGSGATPQPVVVVGDATQESGGASGGGGGGGGGSSSGLIILLVVAIGAGAFYWFYLRKKLKGGGNAE